MQILTDHIKGWHERNDRQPEDDAGAIHPSSLGDCNRRAIYKYKGVPRDLEFNEYKRAIFFHGYRIEDWMNEALAAKGLLIAKNVPVRAEYKSVPVEGTIDHIIGWPLEDPDGWCIADTKSVSDHAFKYQSFPYHHHVLQVGAYQWGLHQMMQSKYPPVLFYIGRGNLKEHPPVSAGDGAMDLALEKLDELLPYIKNQVYPPRPFNAPEEHPYLCASCVRKGYRRKDGTYSTDPEYVPSCEYFKRCWGVLPERWSFWWEVDGREELTF